MPCMECTIGCSCEPSLCWSNAMTWLPEEHLHLYLPTCHVLKTSQQCPHSMAPTRVGIWLWSFEGPVLLAAAWEDYRDTGLKRSPRGALIRTNSEFHGFRITLFIASIFKWIKIWLCWEKKVLGQILLIVYVLAWVNKDNWALAMPSAYRQTGQIGNLDFKNS